MKMTVKNLIEKYWMSLVIHEGIEMVRCGRKPSKKDLPMLKARKQEIINEIKRRQAERQAKMEAKMQEYLEDAQLRRCLIISNDENFNTYRTIDTVEITEKDGAIRAWEPKYSGTHPKELGRETPTMRQIMNGREKIPYGFSGNAFEISEEEEALLLEEQAVAAREAEKALAQVMEEATEKAAREATEKVAEMEAKFAEAKETGEPVELDRRVEPCDGSAVECSLDIVIRYAMPDGTTKVKRIHTH